MGGILKDKQEEIIYPDSDGRPMADNTEQFDWIVMIKENLEWIFADQPQIFIAGDLLWYSVKGDNKRRMAPDIMVVFGRPKGYRGSYCQWEEDNIAPQVVFEVLSPGNRKKEMEEKRDFYHQYGVEEYYLIDPKRGTIKGWRRIGSELVDIVPMNGWVSPRLGIRFQIEKGKIQLYQPKGSPFENYLELAEQRRLAHQRAERLAAKLRALGIDPDEN